MSLRVAKDAVEGLQRPARDGEVQASLSASVGIALSTGAGCTSENLLCAADTAMYDAKATGRGAVRLSAAPTWPLHQRNGAACKPGESTVPA